MQLSENIKLYLNKEKELLIKNTMKEYISTVNALVDTSDINKYTTADVKASLPSALTNQCIRDANSILRKHKKSKNTTIPTLKKLCCYINNQNYKFKDGFVSFPIFIDNKSKRIDVKIRLTNRQKDIINNHKLGILRIVYKNNKLIAQIVYDSIDSNFSNSNKEMGVDLGIKCPAVSYTSDGKVKFYGNGRKNKYTRRYFAIKRKKLQKAKKIKKLKKINDKEQRIMKDIDHKISNQIIKEAINNKVGTIKLEQLTNIRSTTRTSRKNNYSIHTWSFYRLMQFIVYKAHRNGIKVEFVNPKYTSQKCPKCNELHHANDRHYHCTCGYHAHRDVVGAINICNSTEYVGNRHIA